MERAINARPIVQDKTMAMTNDTPASDGPWYLWKSSIVMITVTFIALGSIAFDYLSTDRTPQAGFRIVENGTIINTPRPESHLR